MEEDSLVDGSNGLKKRRSLVDGSNWDMEDDTVK